MPSAIVFIDGSWTGDPCASESGYAAAPAACTPTTRTSGRSALIARATPPSSPPPPVGTSTVRTSGACSSTSRPRVPCPATMSTWSNGWISTAPVSSANRRAADQRLLEHVSLEDHVGAVRPGGPLLRDRRALGHEHGGLDAEQLGGQRDALGVVAGRGRDHAARPLLGGQPGDPDVAAADLERAGALEVLALEPDRPADQGGEPARLLHRGHDRDVADHLAGRLDVRQGHHARVLVSHRPHRPRGRRSRGAAPVVLLDVRELSCLHVVLGQLLDRIVAGFGVGGEVLDDGVHGGRQRDRDQRTRDAGGEHAGARSPGSRRAGAPRPSGPSGTAAARAPRAAARRSRWPA